MNLLLKENRFLLGDWFLGVFELESFCTNPKATRSFIRRSLGRILRFHSQMNPNLKNSWTIFENYAKCNINWFNTCSRINLKFPRVQSTLKLMISKNHQNVKFKENRNSTGLLHTPLSDFHIQFLKGKRKKLSRKCFQILSQSLLSFIFMANNNFFSSSD